MSDIKLVWLHHNSLGLIPIFCGTDTLCQEETPLGRRPCHWYQWLTWLSTFCAVFLFGFALCCALVRFERLVSVAALVGMGSRICSFRLSSSAGTLQQSTTKLSNQALVVSLVSDTHRHSSQTQHADSGWAYSPQWYKQCCEYKVALPALLLSMMTVM